MRVFDVHLTLLRDDGVHHTLGFADVTLGDGKPQITMRPFVILRGSAGGLTVGWPSKPDKKKRGLYRFVEILDPELREAVDAAVLAKYEAERMLGVLPIAPGGHHGRRRAQHGRA